MYPVPQGSSNEIEKLMLLSKRLIKYVKDKEWEERILYKIRMLEQFIGGNKEKQDLMRESLVKYNETEINKKPFKMPFMRRGAIIKNSLYSLSTELAN